MKMKTVLKKLLGGGGALVLSMAMTLGIFAGTGMDARAAGNWEFVSVSPTEETLDEFIAANDFVDYYDGAFDYSDLREIFSMINLDSSVYIIGKAESGNIYYVCQDTQERTGYMNIEKYAELKSRSWYILKPKNAKSMGSSETSGSGTDAYTYSHTHSYSWVTVQDVSSEQDGIEEYRCSCGDVQERCVIPRYMVIVKGLYGAVKDAPQNGTATFDTGSAFTMTDYVIRKLSERTDVTTVITFEYQNQAYKMTIPAGADFTGLLADEDYFYGYFFFANAVGATIEAL